MPPIVISILTLFGGLGAFLLGFKLLSDNVEKLATGKLRQLFNKTSNSRMVGVGIGMVTTAVVQSSSVTTVMTVGFVNAGIMSLYQAACVIMGANIGTTITGQIAALQFLPITEFVMMLTAVGAFMDLLSKNKKVQTIGLAIAGLGLVFIGLELMSNSMASFRDEPIITTALTSISNPILLLLVGALITAVVQSSSAVTAIVILLVGAGITIGNGGNSVLFVILGTNIGTCVTALLSSVGANTNAKRACLFHFLFNTVGSIIFLIVLVCWPSFNDMTFKAWFPEAQTQIAMFHTAFNVICTLLYLPFVKQLVKLTTIIIPDKKTASKAEDGFMDKRLLRTPSLAIGQLQKQTYNMSALAMASLEKSFESFAQGDESELEKITEQNEEIEKLSKNITDYLVLVSAEEIAYEDERILSMLHHNVSDIARVAELSENLVKYTRKKVAKNLEFSEKVNNDLRAMVAKIREQHDLTMQIVENRDFEAIKVSDEIESEIDSMRKSLTKDHIKRMASGECSVENNNVFINLVCNLERAADHINYVAHSIEEL
ncbi:MAG: Na/Pi cotransporter family protein [Clostridiales bacterium]|nr:Na/Pi cotransporter family protein [Clostridiales bacterium]